MTRRKKLSARDPHTNPRDRYYELYEFAPDAYVTLNEAGKVLEGNMTAAVMLGVQRQSLAGADLSSFVSRQSQPAWRLFRRSMFSEKKQACEIDMRRAQGGPLTVRMEAVAAGPKEDRRCLTALIDITEQKRTEFVQTFLVEVGAVLASTLDYAETLKNIGGLVLRDLADCFWVDSIENGDVRRLESMSRQDLGVPGLGLPLKVPASASCLQIARWVVDHKRPLLIAPFSPQTIAPLSWNDDLEALRADGLNSLISAPLLAHGTLVGVMSLAAASSSRVYDDADLRVAEALAVRAALSMANARLFAESRLAIHARDDVLAIVSHDLKNPLTTMSLAVHLLRQCDKMDTERMNNLTETVQRAVDKMQLLIADLLDFERIQSGSFTLTKSRQDLSRLITAAAEGFKLMAEHKRQKIEMDLPGVLPPISVDSHRIGQLVSNLLANAIKFTPEGGFIRVAVRRSGLEVVVSVADNGPGISPEHLSKVFDWFWRPQGDGNAGSGLGLAIAKGIARAHGGRIWAESRLGAGSSFLFALPIEGET
jgi:PAS domain S-box-containing protein